MCKPIIIVAETENSVTKPRDGMKSTFEMIKRKALESDNGSYAFVVNDPNALLHTFRVGIGDYYASENWEAFVGRRKNNSAPTIEVWITTRQKLEDIPEFNEGVCSINNCIKKYDTIDDDEREEWALKIAKKNDGEKLYDYHLEYIPSGHVADFFPTLYHHMINVAKSEPEPVKAVSDDGTVVTLQKGSLAEFAVSHGCDFMDMSTMTTYRRI